MPTRLPRVLGLDDLLRLRKPLSEKPIPLVYFSDREFARLVKNAVRFPRRPRGLPLIAFEPWPQGGMVQGDCRGGPDGQVCFGRWIPKGSGRSGGIYFGCVCRVIKGPPHPLPLPQCQLVLDVSTGVFECRGPCGGRCRLGLWKDPATGTVLLGCRCLSP
jgi:hypothetical protein